LKQVPQDGHYVYNVCDKTPVLEVVVGHISSTLCSVIMCQVHCLHLLMYEGRVICNENSHDS